MFQMVSYGYIIDTHKPKSIKDADTITDNALCTCTTYGTLYMCLIPMVFLRVLRSHFNIIWNKHSQVELDSSYIPMTSGISMFTEFQQYLLFFQQYKITCTRIFCKSMQNICGFPGKQSYLQRMEIIGLILHIRMYLGDRAGIISYRPIIQGNYRSATHVQ